MKCSESWLREWVNPKLSREELCHTLTMGGLEVEELMPAAEAFTGIVVGEIKKCDKHPDADQLKICAVDIGEQNLLKIVCGASNARIGLKAPLAKVNAVLPDNTVITASSIRGVSSDGMLCSASEIGFITEGSLGLLELPKDAPIGQDLWTYLKLEDYIIDVSITPNRGDCLSVRGIAREVSALTASPLKEIPIPTVKPSIKDALSVNIMASACCPHYVGRIIHGVKADTPTPTWLKERLRRSGVRSINAIVDVANYVMLELGQPMHAFDLDKIKSGIVVRHAQQGERITLLDGSLHEVDQDTLVIADEQTPLAIAGVMGGLDSGVTTLTKNIFLESAFFSPIVIARQRQYYGLSSEAAYRYERGVDPTIQREAIERATALILDIAGGEAGPMVDEVCKGHLPQQAQVRLSKTQLTRLLGLKIPDHEVDSIFTRLRFQQKKSLFAKSKKAEWEVLIPPYRFDVSIPEDLIEEIARLYGYDKLPTHHIKGRLALEHVSAAENDWYALRQTLAQLSYHEIISYSFVEQTLAQLLDPSETLKALVNPISADMTVMRTNLWPGLIQALRYNISRQQHRVRLFELGTCFLNRETIVEEQRLAGLLYGPRWQEQWGVMAQPVDFYDVKGDIEKILAFFYPNEEWTFTPSAHSALHPGQSIDIYHKGQRIGLLGALHPLLTTKLNLPNGVFLFELKLDHFKHKAMPRFHEFSKFPEIRRDLAIVVNQAIPVKRIQDTIKEVIGDWLQDVFVFDVYQGKGITPGQKSIALALIMQHPTRTLVDDEVAALLERVIATLGEQLGAELRS